MAGPLGVAMDVVGGVATAAKAAGDAARSALKATKGAWEAVAGDAASAAAKGVKEGEAVSAVSKRADAAAEKVGANDAKDVLQKELSALNLKKFNGTKLTQSDIERMKELRNDLPAWEKPAQPTKRTLGQLAYDNKVALGVGGAVLAGGAITAGVLGSGVTKKSGDGSVPAPQDGAASSGAPGGSKVAAALGAQKPVSVPSLDGKTTYSVDFSDPKNPQVVKADGSPDPTLQVKQNGSDFQIVDQSGKAVSQEGKLPDPASASGGGGGEQGSQSTASSLQDLPSGASIGHAQSAATHGGAG